MLDARPDMFWGLIASFGIGSLLLLVLNLPLIGIWVSMLRIPFRWLYPAILIFVSLGVYSVRGSSFDIFAVALIGVIGYALSLAQFNPALLLLGSVLGPLIETNLRRALLIGRGDPMVFLQRPIAAPQAHSSSWPRYKCCAVAPRMRLKRRADGHSVQWTQARQ